MRAILPVVVVVMMLAPGCRCSSAPPEPASTAPSAKPSASGPVDDCPPSPDWGSPTPEREHLVAELLMQPELASVGTTGTGIRIYDDGRVFAYDQAIFSMKDGKLTSRPIPPRWRQHRTLGSMRLDELRTAIAAVDPLDLAGWQGGGRTKKGRPSFMTVQRDGALVRSCYRGVEGGQGQQRVDAAVKKLMGEAFDASVQERDAPKP